MNHLRLLIAPGWPQTHRECAWALYAPDGRLLQQGHSEPRHWPGVATAGQDGPDNRLTGQACDLILLGAQSAQFRVRLPRGPAGQRNEVIAAAVEEHLLDDPEHAQLALRPGEDSSDGWRDIAVIDRNRLAGLCETLRQLGLKPHSAWPLAFLLPAKGEQGLAWAEGGLLALLHPNGQILHLPLDATLAEWPATLAELGFTLPVQAVDRENSETGRLALQAAHNAGWLRIASDPPDLAMPPPDGLLNGPLAPPSPQGDWRQSFRRPLRLAAGLALLAAGLLVADWGRLAWQATNYRQQIAQHYRDSFPTGAMVAPLLQMQRQLDQRRHTNGQLATSDFLALLAPLSEVAHFTAHRLDYDGQHLQVEASLPPSGLDDLRRRARQAGQRLEIAQQTPAGEQLKLNFSLTPDVAQ
ncbi:MAG: hypothetical protein D3M94_08420 [Rhodocyclales bacterium GT-UBC]|nr:MAG: hypothetical protein D3M94_08420 [Rhodocyclales bacterium GT-UBC]